MRKNTIALLAAGALIFTSSVAMASESNLDTAFKEKHYLDGIQQGATEVIVPDTNLEVGGNHYKKVDFVEVGRHGSGFGGFQLNSRILKDQALENEDPLTWAPGQLPADDSWGYTSGVTPFVSGNAGGPGNNTDPNGDPLGGGDGIQEIMAAPAYTMPCPSFVTGDYTDFDWNDPTNPVNGSNPGMLGDCPANVYATDPQTNHTNSDPNVWDGTVLDDIYQGVGANDTSGTNAADASAALALYGYDGLVGNGGANNKVHYRLFDQWLDQLFYNGKRGTIKSADGVTTLTVPTIDGITRVFNIDDTLDQDIADWEDAAETSGENEIMGIYGKLTLLFQIAAPAGVDPITGLKGITANLDQVGCASLGSLDDDAENASQCTGNTFNDDGMAYAEEWKDGTNTQAAALSANVIDQWVVSDMWDIHPYRNDDATIDLATDKYRGDGVVQGYSTWFRDGSGKDFDYDYTYQGGHGDINKTFEECGGSNANECHEHPDP